MTPACWGCKWMDVVMSQVGTKHCRRAMQERMQKIQTVGCSNLSSHSFNFYLTFASSSPSKIPLHRVDYGTEEPLGKRGNQGCSMTTPPSSRTPRHPLTRPSWQRRQVNVSELEDIPEEDEDALASDRSTQFESVVEAFKVLIGTPQDAWTTTLSRSFLPKARDFGPN